MKLAHVGIERPIQHPLERPDWPSPPIVAIPPEPPDDDREDGGDDDGDDESRWHAPAAGWFRDGVWYLWRRDAGSTFIQSEIDARILKRRRAARRWASRLADLLRLLRGDEPPEALAARCRPAHHKRRPRWYTRTAGDVLRIETGQTLAALRLTEALRAVYRKDRFDRLPSALQQGLIWRHCQTDRQRAIHLGHTFRHARGDRTLDEASALAGVSVRSILAIENGSALRDFPAVQDMLAAFRDRLPAGYEPVAYVLKACRK